MVAGVALGLGYYLGLRSSTQNAVIAPIPPSESKDKEPRKEPEVDSEEEDDALGDGDLNAVKAGFMQPCKMVWIAPHSFTSGFQPLQVLIVRTDLKMTQGKIAAQ